VARVSPIRSVLEWLGAAAILLGALWLVSGHLRDWVGPQPAALAEDAADDEVSGIPIGATQVPLLVLLDGTEIKVGDAHGRLLKVLDEKHATGPSQTTHGDYGERWVRAYRHGTTKFIVVCERREPTEILKVVAIYLP
jgi:hypothetical protein